MELEIEPVHQAKRLEFVFGQLPGKPARYLAAELLGALATTGIEFVVAIHVGPVHRDVGAPGTCPPCPCACLPRSRRGGRPGRPDRLAQRLRRDMAVAAPRPEPHRGSTTTLLALVPLWREPAPCRGRGLRLAETAARLKPRSSPRPYPSRITTIPSAEAVGGDDVGHSGPSGGVETPQFQTP